MRAVPQATGLSDLSTVLTRDIFKLAGKTSGVLQLMAIQYIIASTLAKGIEWAPITRVEFSVALQSPVAEIAEVLADAEKRKLIEAIDPSEAHRRNLQRGLEAPIVPPRTMWYRACPENWAKAEGYVR